MSPMAMQLVMFGMLTPKKAVAEKQGHAVDLHCQKPCTTCPVPCALQGTEQTYEPWDLPK
jgi:hypothetical protein